MRYFLMLMAALAVTAALTGNASAGEHGGLYKSGHSWDWGRHDHGHYWDSHYWSGYSHYPYYRDYDMEYYSYYPYYRDHDKRHYRDRDHDRDYDRDHRFHPLNRKHSR